LWFSFSNGRGRRPRGSAEIVVVDVIVSIVSFRSVTSPIHGEIRSWCALSSLLLCVCSPWILEAFDEQPRKIPRSSAALEYRLSLVVCHIMFLFLFYSTREGRISHIPLLSESPHILGMTSTLGRSAATIKSSITSS